LREDADFTIQLMSVGCIIVNQCWATAKWRISILIITRYSPWHD